MMNQSRCDCRWKIHPLHPPKSLAVSSVMRRSREQLLYVEYVRLWGLFYQSIYSYTQNYSYPCKFGVFLAAECDQRLKEDTGHWNECNIFDNRSANKVIKTTLNLASVRITLSYLQCFQGIVVYTQYWEKLYFSFLKFSHFRCHFF